MLHRYATCKGTWHQAAPESYLHHRMYQQLIDMRFVLYVIMACVMTRPTIALQPHQKTNTQHAARGSTHSHAHHYRITHLRSCMATSSDATHMMQVSCHTSTTPISTSHQHQMCCHAELIKSTPLIDTHHQLQAPNQPHLLMLLACCSWPCPLPSLLFSYCHWEQHHH